LASIKGVDIVIQSGWGGSSNYQIDENLLYTTDLGVREYLQTSFVIELDIAQARVLADYKNLQNREKKSVADRLSLKGILETLIMNALADMEEELRMEEASHQEDLDQLTWERENPGKCPTCRGIGAYFEDEFVTADSQPVECVTCHGTGRKSEDDDGRSETDSANPDPREGTGDVHLHDTGVHRPSGDADPAEQDSAESGEVPWAVSESLGGD
jgi:hypothetical protein